MRTARFIKIFLIVFLLMAWSQMALAEQKSIILQKGTTVQKIGSGHFKFTLPDKQIVEIQKFDPMTGTIGAVSVVDPNPPHKPVMRGKEGKLIVTKKLKKEDAGKFPRSDYVMIDDDVTWLPATITFQLVGIIDPEPPGRPIEKGKTKELSPQPDPPGKIR